MRRRVVVICLGLIVGICCLLVRRSHAVSWALSEQMQRGPGTTVDFAEIAPFAWDRVHIFGPYTPHSRIDANLGFHWTGAERTTIAMNESVNLVVFVRGTEVAHWFEHVRHEELAELADPNGHAREQARFAVCRDGPEERLKLVSLKR